MYYWCNTLINVAHTGLLGPWEAPTNVNVVRTVDNVRNVTILRTVRTVGLGLSHGPGTAVCATLLQARTPTSMRHVLSPGLRQDHIPVQTGSKCH